MSTVFRKYSTTISVLLLLVLSIVACLYPTNRLLLGTILFFIFGTVSFAVFEKHREAYLMDRISRFVFIRTVILEVTVVLFVMILAGFLGRTIAQTATKQVGSDFTKLVMSIAIGLIVGIVAGTFVKQLSSRLIGKASDNFPLRG